MFTRKEIYIKIKYLKDNKKMTALISKPKMLTLQNLLTVTVTHISNMSQIWQLNILCQSRLKVSGIPTLSNQ